MVSSYHNKTQKLISRAHTLMCFSSDPVHDLSHVARVVDITQKLASSLRLSPRDIEVLTLAAWWHDTGRTITKKNRWAMILLDDMISSIMLIRHALRHGLCTRISLEAAHIILCKNIGTGALFTKLFLRKPKHILLNILADADNLDMFHITRFDASSKLAIHSFFYKKAFQFWIWYNLNTERLILKTAAARTFLQQKIKELIIWLSQKYINEQFIIQFGKQWVKKTTRQLHNLHAKILLMNTSTT
ncbi:MAG TPA: hypothetical protein DCS29_01745 [Candidatus Magasanikbacteria bacterium]|nr:MAG: hypothetical protein A2479_01315 [Candidatus Magasanikbacteria bacterium RIFOXYC2_FULL_39_8]HAT03480.1 hypothetical protein [Candidatus Magasanikbacteria bacterium]